MDIEHIKEICEKYQNKVAIWIGWKVFAGQIENFGKTSLLMTDKLGNKVPISYKDISLIKEYRENINRRKDDGRNKNY